MDRKVAYSLGLLTVAFAALLVAYAQATEIAATARREPFLSEKAAGSGSDSGQLPAAASTSARPFGRSIAARD
jgi:hypothetical protein